MIKYSDGKWYSICDSRLEDIELEKAWSDNVVKVFYPIDKHLIYIIPKPHFVTVTLFRL